jgi:FKBP-type peptidyl-prolyl cis-trans isomerase FkpA
MRILFAALAAFILIEISACQNEGIKTEHGYRVIKHTNNDGAKAVAGDQALIHVATYVGDSLMGSTYTMGGAPREYTIPEKEKLGPRVPPVYDALLMMAKGDSVTVYQTLDSTMVRNLPPSLKKEKEAVYHIKLVDLVSKADLEKKTEAQKAAGVAVKSEMDKILAEYKGGKLGDRLQKTASGLEYVIVDKGAGAALKAGDQVPTNYYGILKSNGTGFDNSYDRGKAVPFTVGQMIPGFDEGLLLLNRGGKAYFFIPAKLGYGDQPVGSIPPNSDLVFYVDLQN